MTTINPWINFNGNAEEAFSFYKSVFGGEFTKVIRFKEIALAETNDEDVIVSKINDTLEVRLLNTRTAFYFTLKE